MGTASRRRVDVRVVAATNADIEAAIDDGEFRLDLFYRLNVLAIRVPSLRERVSDIPELIDHFFSLRGLPVRQIDEDAAACLSRYRWPGNIRELENEIERVTVLYPRAVRVSADMLSDRVAGKRGIAGFDVNMLYESPLPQAVGYLEENLVRKMLAKTNWNKSRSARELGLSRQGLLKKIKRYGIERDEPERRGAAPANDSDRRDRGRGGG
jgi:DNA-binding NtrC family response regulator